MVTVTVCVGSSCHIKGAREVIVRFSDLVQRHGLEEQVELKGSFCMERCGEGMNWKFNDEDVTSANVEEAEQTLRARLSRLKGARDAADDAWRPPG